MTYGRTLNADDHDAYLVMGHGHAIVDATSPLHAAVVFVQRGDTGPSLGAVLRVQKLGAKLGAVWVSTEVACREAGLWAET